MRVDGLNDVWCEIARVRGRKPHAANSGRLCNAQQQLGKAHLPARGIGVGIHRLTKKLNLRVTQFGQLAHFAENGLARAAPLRPSRVRHDAIRARLVAALDDGQVSPPGIIPAGNLRLKSLVGVGVESGDAMPAFFKLGKQLR